MRLSFGYVESEGSLRFQRGDEFWKVGVYGSRCQERPLLEIMV